MSDEKRTTPTLLRPPRGGASVGDYSLHDFAAKWMMQQDDLAEVGRYREANRRLGPAGRPRLILMGDSITEFWVEAHALGSDRLEVVNRGVAGQNTSQMLLRFGDDVAGLEPAAVAILGGTNDLRAYVGDPADIGPGALERVSRNLTAMADIAEGRRFKVILSTLPPVGLDREAVARDAHAINNVNDWIRAFGARRAYPVADYHQALAGPDGALPPGLSEDGVHPNVEGYAAMAPALREALRSAGLVTNTPKESA